MHKYYKILNFKKQFKTDNLIKNDDIVINFIVKNITP